MARLLTSGAETKHTASDNISNFGGVAYETTIVRTGVASFKLTGNSEMTLNASISSNGTYYGRTHAYTTALPGSGLMSALFQVDNAAHIGAWLDSNGQLGLGWWNGTNPVFLGSNRYSWQLSTWTRIELKVVTGTSVYTSIELRVNGTSIDTWTGSIAVNFGRFEGGDLSGNALTQYHDDLAVNDSTGSNQNSWPGDGRVRCLLPIGDSAVGSGWQKPGGATTNLYTSIDNTPPVGVADSTSSANAEKMIRNATSDATTNYDVTLASYTGIGIGGGDTIVLCNLFACVGSDNTTDTDGILQGVSNPTIASQSFTSYDASNVVAGTFATGWKRVGNTPVYSPSVTKGTSPVVRVGKRTATTRVADVCIIGMYVEYIPDVTPPTVNLTTSTTFKMSDETGKDSYSYSFSANEDIQAWKVKVVPSSGSVHTAGTVIESGGSVSSGTAITGSVTETELVTAGGAEGSNVVKFFAQDLSGNWST